jgi:phenylalanyl-tRNA synthetase alpha chain
VSVVNPLTVRGVTMPMSQEQLDHALGLRDLTDPSAGSHALQMVVDAAAAALRTAWQVPVRLERGERIVAVGDNYDKLRYPPDAAARDRRYTRYIGGGRMLRAHTTAHIPGLLRRVAADGPDDVVLCVPGVCYRRDVIDRHHVGEPHQLELWRIRRSGDRLTVADLTSMIELVVAAVLPDRRITTPPNPHPYTVDGREIYVDDVEVGECGLAHPEVLAAAGLPPGASGLAMGLGLDRLTMLAKGMDDIRLLRSTDPRVVAQLGDLSRYRPVSGMPPIRRDLSIAVAADLTPELVGDRARAALGDDAGSIEEIAVLSETGYDDLPAAARARLGLRPEQKNLLVRVVVRDHERTLTDADANRLRDRVYAALHAGTAHQWAAKLPAGSHHPAAP